MEGFYGSQEEGFEGGLDIQHEAQRFEDRLKSDGAFYMDAVTIDEVYDYYRAMDESSKAQQLLDFAVQQYPYNAEFYFKRSCLAADLDDHTEALRQVNVALELSPADATYLTQKARALTGLGQYPEAHDALAQALELAEEPAEIYYQLGQVRQAEGKLEEAIAYYHQALRGDATFEDPLYEMVFCYETAGLIEAGQSFLRRFLDETPYSAAGWYNLGLLYHKEGLFEKAILAFDYAALIQDDFLSAYSAKAGSLMELHKFDEAIVVLLQSLTIEKNDVGTLLSLGECYEELHDYPRARFYYGKANDLYSNLPDAWYGIASTYEAEQRYLEAIHYYKKAIEHNGEFFDAWLGLADSEYALGNEVSAFEALKRCIELYAEDNEMWRTWGERLLDDRGADAACAWLEEGLRHNPTSVELVYQYAAYALLAGAAREGMTYLENALVMDYHLHHVFYSYFPQGEQLPMVRQIIDQYRPR